jgi:hypothetical protein
MFWIFSSLVGLTFFAVTLGQYSVWYSLMKLALMAASMVIAILVAMLMLRKLRRD